MQLRLLQQADEVLTAVSILLVILAELSFAARLFQFVQRVWFGVLLDYVTCV